MTQNTFSQVKAARIHSLNIEYEEYQHNATGAKHIHLCSDNDENVFLVALRTVPQDSTGVAHILEHTTLCGSKKYPVRDPFFMMIRRSLNTFMNAFTSSDWTAYPFASKNRKDFNNLLEVYLDAVFFARLDQLDFCQEGHRLEFEKPGDKDSSLVYKGVVFNEMKGAMSSVTSQLWQSVGEALFPDTTYGFNSGGDPDHITDLAYEQLIDFYRVHYHPDNAIFMTFGDISAADHQRRFEELVLRQFSSAGNFISVPKQAPFPAPIKASGHYPVTDEEDLEARCHFVMAWVVDSVTDPLSVLTLHLLSSVLLDNSASPLQFALETTDLGTAPSPLCGLDDSGLEMVFVCGLEGARAENNQAFEKLVIDTLEKVSREGVRQETLSALLDRLELQQREISGDSYPYGLQLILSCLPTAMHRGQPEMMLDIDPILENLRKSIRDPDFIRNLVASKLINNPHRVTVELKPDIELAGRKIEEERAKLDRIRAALNNHQCQEIIETASRLNERQQQQDDPSVLPKVTLEDIPAEIPVPASDLSTIAGRPAAFYPQGTNGLIYQEIIVAIPPLGEPGLDRLGLHNRLLTDLGIGDRDYMAVQEWQSRVSGGINSFSSISGQIDDEQQVRGYFTIATKGLKAHGADIAELLYQTFHDVRFDEMSRIRELIAQTRARAEQSITGSGHSLAMAIACQGLSPAARLNHASSGVLGVQRLKELDDSLDDGNCLEKLASELADVHREIISNPARFLLVGEEGEHKKLQEAVAKHWREDQGGEDAMISLPSCRDQSRELWLCNTQVNFCARAYATVTANHEDAPALSVLAGVLRNGFLHTAIREKGGAYGGGANQDSSIGAFRFYSYRDPRIAGTLNDFDQSVQWLLDGDHERRVVEEAILGVISSIDKPASPAGTAKQHYHNLLFDRTPEQQQLYRQRVLSVTQQDLKRVAEKYLQPEAASTGIISHAGEANNYEELCAGEGIAIITL